MIDVSRKKIRLGDLLIEEGLITAQPCDYAQQQWQRLQVTK